MLGDYVDAQFSIKDITIIYSERLREKLLSIFRGINLEYFDANKINESEEINLIKKWKLDKQKKIILLPGRLTTWKGQEMFIESLNIFKQKNPEKLFHAIILGSDQGRKIYKKKINISFK